MAKLFAILGDIHSNLEALEVVMADCAAQGVTDYLCTGDVVGYNANPHECMEIIRALNCPVVKGNHDHYVSSDQNLSDFHPNAAAVVEWTRKQLTDDEMAWLEGLPFTAAKMGITLVHATMDNPESFGYVFDTAQAESSFSWQKTPICFHGHTHCPKIYERRVNDVCYIELKDLPDGTFKLMAGRKYFINVGSVGQPRDLDPRASYVLFDPATKCVTFRRLEYDIAGAQAKIRSAGLPERLAERLEVGQ